LELLDVEVDTSRAFLSMNSRRGSTASPIKMVKISSAPTASSIVTLRRVRLSGFMVVSQSCSGFISPRPL